MHVGLFGRSEGCENQKTPHIGEALIKLQEKVGPDGLEPSTHGLKVRCSTD